MAYANNADPDQPKEQSDQGLHCYSTAQVVFQNPPRAGGEWIRVERIKF